MLTVHTATAQREYESAIAVSAHDAQQCGSATASLAKANWMNSSLKQQVCAGAAEPSNFGLLTERPFVFAAKHQQAPNEASSVFSAEHADASTRVISLYDGCGVQDLTQDKQARFARPGSILAMPVSQQKNLFTQHAYSNYNLCSRLLQPYSERCDTYAA